MIDSIAPRPLFAFSLGLVTGYLYRMVFLPHHCSARLFSGLRNMSIILSRKPVVVKSMAPCLSINNKNNNDNSNNNNNNNN